MKKMVSGNEAIALGALSAGVKVISGYPGTPSSEVIGSLWHGDYPGTKIEWSTNEKVAFEVAAGASIVGYRSLCTMKMSGLNVAYDSIIGIAYSGCRGALVIYVADDPGVTAGMCEQDSRSFALMSDTPVLEPASVQEAYDLTRFAFELSEAIQSPVYVRSVTNVAASHAVIELEGRQLPKEGLPLPEKNIAKFTKAGSAICQTQHRELIERLALSGDIIRAKGLNRLKLATKPGGIGLISVGVVNDYAAEALGELVPLGLDPAAISTLRLVATLPYPIEEIAALLQHCSTVLVAEELEPHLEHVVYQEAYRLGVKVKIVGKLDKVYSRIGEYDAATVLKGIFAAYGQTLPALLQPSPTKAETLCAARPITFCAGCPHRGVYMALNAAVRKLGYKKDEVMITGDIGCTILGMNPPFNALWTELSMGASIPLAQGVVYTGNPKPVIATIGDSTFFHAGIAGLVNAIQHNVNLTVVVLDNGWTAMTGMQVNPGTLDSLQRDDSRTIDLVQVIKGLGVDSLSVVDPFDQAGTIDAISTAIPKAGVKVVVARRECAIQARRRKVKHPPFSFISEKCTLCKVCINQTGCPAISLGEKSIKIDMSQCTSCGLCAQVCKFGALAQEVAQ